MKNLVKKTTQVILLSVFLYLLIFNTAFSQTSNPYACSGSLLLVMGSAGNCVKHLQYTFQQSGGYTLPSLPPGPAWTQGGLLGILTSIANFLIAAGIVIAIITIVISGIMYFRAGSDTEAKKAKGWFRNGIIGALIILGVGVIIWTIYGIVTGGFFG